MCTSLPLPTSPCERVSRSDELGARRPPASGQEDENGSRTATSRSIGPGATEGRAGRKQEERVGGIQMFGRVASEFPVESLPASRSLASHRACVSLGPFDHPGFAAQCAVDGCFVLPMVCACCSLLPWHAQHVPACWIRMTEGVGERPSTALCPVHT